MQTRAILEHRPTGERLLVCISARYAQSQNITKIIADSRRRSSTHRDQERRVDILCLDRAEIASRLGTQQPSISRTLKTLISGRLIRKNAQGRYVLTNFGHQRIEVESTQSDNKKSSLSPEDLIDLGTSLDVIQQH